MSRTGKLLLDQGSVSPWEWIFLTCKSATATDGARCFMPVEMRVGSIGERCNLCIDKELFVSIHLGISIPDCRAKGNRRDNCISLHVGDKV